MPRIVLSLLICITLAANCNAVAESDDFASLKFEPLGTLAPRPASAIAGSVWGIQISSFPGPRELELVEKLGVKWVRLMFGLYEGKMQPSDYQRLDTLVNQYLALGVKPVFVVYPMTRAGDKLVPGNMLFRDPERLKPYLAYLKEGVAYYQGRVHHWEVWNEPNYPEFWSGPISASEYARIVRVLAATIKGSAPLAKIAAGAFAGVPVPYIKEFFRSDPGPDVAALSFHPYRTTPEELEDNIREMVQQISAYSPRKLELWSSECGYPSAENSAGWIGSGPWSEDLQATWLLRRQLSNYAVKSPINIYYALVDIPHQFIEHGPKKNMPGIDATGLVKTSYEAKKSFYAYQNLISLIDDSLSPLEHDIQINDISGGPLAPKPKVVALGKAGKLVGCAYWLPLRMGEKRSLITEMALPAEGIKTPVLVDPATGTGYKVAKFSVSSGKLLLSKVPISETPLFLLDLQGVKFTGKN